MVHGGEKRKFGCESVRVEIPKGRGPGRIEFFLLLWLRRKQVSFTSRMRKRRLCYRLIEHFQSENALKGSSTT
jgi:hypothetical protein